MKVFFASDVHVGVLRDPGEARQLENRFLGWLEKVRREGEALYLMGDIFDFWFEYKRVIPKGYSTVLAKLRELSRDGVDIHFFHGNHDEWTRDYLTGYCGLTVHRNEPEWLELQGKKIVAGHGHNLGLDPRFHVRLMHAAFRSKWLFRLCSTLFHPDFFIGMGNRWSRSNMLKKRGRESYVFRPENNRLVDFVKNEKWKEADYFLFGHFHTPTDYRLEGTEKEQHLLILGEWLRHPHYAVLENGELTLHRL